ncbi:FAD-dependent oxidoreductase [Paucibacter sp. B2R-40]|uniref:FAD-binding oxidoreductase n=1 Tax=Paucibacter sp. B2R-40 TaxID=2893554 RepID=UPI0021E50ADE|nr:FAD-dependent oxidoreductase [Paucibacter sp. B2R-40]MCV2355211.1 FAD-dependent oxidoreductase [Paucibacter sp. B2R-40]
MDRRKFLQYGSGAGAAALLSACGGGSGLDPAPPPTPTPAPPLPPAPPSGGPAASEWEALASQLKGQLIRPGHADYERLRRPANARFDAVLPQALIRCDGAADIRAGLAFASRLKLAVVPRGGGHSYIGNSTGPGLVIDVGSMDSVRLDGELATVGAGAKLADVYEGLINQGRCIPSGSCVTVGIAGITQGGGFGVIDRAYGLTCDVLRSARVVTADGTELLCSESQNADLFWALRGGGGGNFGIVSEFTFQTHAVTPLQQFAADFSLADLPAVLAAWSKWPKTMPDQIWSQLVVSPSGCHLWGFSIGDAAALLPHWQSLLAQIGRTALNNTVQARSYREVMLGACAGLSPTQCHLPGQNPAGLLGRVAMAASSDFFDSLADPQGMAAALSAAMLERRSAGRPGTVIMNLMGGAVGRVAADTTAFAHRQALFSAQYYAEYSPLASSSEVSEGEQWAHGMRQTLRPWSSGRAYQNYLDALIPDPEQAYYGSNLARLKQIKAKFDPVGLFKQAQGISAA